MSHVFFCRDALDIAGMSDIAQDAADKIQDDFMDKMEMFALYYVGKGLLPSLKNSKNPKMFWIELTPPTHPHPNCFVWKPITTWTEHSNHINQQLLAMSIYRQDTHSILLKNISTGLGLFWEDFPKKILRNLDPPGTHPLP